MTLKIVFVIGFLAAASPGIASTYYVSGSASGSNTACSVSAPCNSLETAILKTIPGDRIVCQTPPNQVPITITASVTIDCTGARAVLGDNGKTGSNSAAVGIVINIAPSADDPLRVVRLRGFTIDGAYRGNTFASGRLIDRGIEIIAATAVYIEDSVISNVNQQGIYDHRTGGQTRLYVKDTIISGNAGPGIVAASQGPAVTVLDNVSLLNNTYGVAVASGNNVVITRSAISGNATAGVHADTGGRINLTNSVLSNNTTNVNAYGAVSLQENSIYFSNTAIAGGGAVSLGANRFSGNGAIGATPSLASGATGDVYN